jgi:hypothetical protein
MSKKNESHLVVEDETHTKVKVQAALYKPKKVTMKELVNDWSELHDAVVDNAKVLGISTKEMYDLVYIFLKQNK